MRRTLGVGAAVVAVLLFAAVPAQAKGEGGKITLTNAGGGSGPGLGGPGGGGSGKTGGGGGSGGGGVLSSPITITGEPSAFWFAAGGFDETLKPAQPQTLLGEVVAPSKLGPALAATATFLCGPGLRGTIHQTVYPYAKGGAQVFTPHGQEMCGMPLASGWHNAKYTPLWDTLVKKGLPRHAPPAPAASFAGSGGPVAASSTSWTLIVSAVALLAGLLVIAAAAQRRRAQVPA